MHIPFCDRDQLIQATEESWSRLSSKVVFAFGVEVDSFELMEKDPHLGEVEAAEIAARLDGDALIASIDTSDLGPVSLRPLAVDVGRGASGEGVAIEVALLLGGPGAVLASIELAKKVARVWRRLWRARQRPPRVSVGAARYLCLADLAQRRGENMDGVQVIWEGDVGPGLLNDLGFSRGDLYLVIFARDDGTWLYLIDSFGHVIHRGNGSCIPQNVAHYVGGLDYDLAPKELPYLLGVEPPEGPDAYL